MKPPESISKNPYNDEPSAISPNIFNRMPSRQSLMPSRNLLLPNGQRLTVLPVFGGFFFKSNEIYVNSSSAFPAGWTVILQTESNNEDGPELEPSDSVANKMRQTLPYRQPTLDNDNLFISSISNPSSSDFQSPTSPARQIAMMLWASLYWYFHQEEPPRFLNTEASKNTPDAGKPCGEWRINIKREGVLRGRTLMQNLERMGLIMCEDSSVGLSPSEKNAECWSNMFTSRRAFWQIPEKLFLFPLSPVSPNSLFPGSPFSSRPNSPVWGEHKNLRESGELIVRQHLVGPTNSSNQYQISYPAAPLQYMITSGVRHPLRRKPPCQGEVFYSRYIPSIGQYLSFRTASLSERPVLTNGPSASAQSLQSPSHHSNLSLPSFSTTINIGVQQYHHHHDSVTTVPTPLVSPLSPSDFSRTSDLQLLHKWMNIPRVSKFWGCDGPISKQEEFLRKNLLDRHSFPVIGLWDGKPFGYFEIYWTKEDKLSKYLGHQNLGDWDRGLHVLVGEDEFRGPDRVKCWLTALAHWAFVEDARTNSVVLEPRVDNEKFISYLQATGFFKEREISLPHKQSALMRLRRENFEAPVL